jgi:putative spermidine/putrescine transport system permease protein
MSSTSSLAEIAEIPAVKGPREPQGRRRDGWRKYISDIRVVPLLLMYLVFFLIPQLYFYRIGLYRSAPFGEITGPIGFQTAQEVVTTSFYLQATVRTIQLSILCAIISSIFAYPIAYIIIRMRKLGGLLFIVTSATMFGSSVAMVLGWRVILANNGTINSFLMWLGVINEPINMSNNFLAVVIGTAHAVLPIAIIGLMPVMQQVPKSQVLAARSLGASEGRIFRSVFFPQTLSGLVAVSMLTFATTAGAFTTPVLLGGGKVGVLSILMFSDATTALNFPRAAILALGLFAIVLAAVTGSLIFARRTRQGDGKR